MRQGEKRVWHSTTPVAVETTAVVAGAASGAGGPYAAAAAADVAAVDGTVAVAETVAGVEIAAVAGTAAVAESSAGESCATVASGWEGALVWEGGAEEERKAFPSYSDLVLALFQFFQKRRAIVSTTVLNLARATFHT